jgi:hypothetical protein
MAVERDSIVMYYIAGAPIIGTMRSINNAGDITLDHPFRITPDGKGNISLGALFLKEEWITFNPANVGSCMELSVLDSLKDVYIKYQQEAWSGIILPGNSGLVL